ncbi:hypothetical protein ACEN33_01465 [Ruoffia sp. FAM 24228]|uniref:hypothetical protein n=1 Tax=Ruoffia sp. FAM 24228 TaxID=3259517 RepID=UPI0038869995
MQTFKELSQKHNAEMSQIETFNIRINDFWGLEVWKGNSTSRYEVEVYSLENSIRSFETVYNIPSLELTDNVIKEMIRVFNLEKNRVPFDKMKDFPYNHWLDFNKYLQELDKPLKKIQ